MWYTTLLIGGINMRKIDIKKFWFLFVFIFLIISVVINIVFLFNKSFIKYENDENIVFFGDSLIAKYDVKKFFPKSNVVNKGISGNKTEDLVNRLENDVYDYNPSKVIILIGTNDVNADIDYDDILLNIQTVITGIKLNRSHAKIFIESLYPINEEILKKEKKNSNDNYNNKRIKSLNSEIIKVCKQNDVTYIDLFDKLTDKSGNLKKIYTVDGLHLSNAGYLKVTSVLNDYVSE